MVGTEDVRIVHARLFENGTVPEHPAAAAAATVAFPVVFGKARASVDVLEFRDDTVLQREQVIRDFAHVPHSTHPARARRTLPEARTRISEGPRAGPQAPGAM